MIKTFVGSALDVPVGVIVHGCNCQGVMGAGIAKAIKDLYPAAFEIYRTQYEREGLKLGNISFIEVSPNKWIVNANTQNTFDRNTRAVSYDAVVDCFEKVVVLVKTIKERTKASDYLPIIFPKIGAGLGGGDWDIIEKIIDKTVPDEMQKHLYVLP